ncbi:CpsD/CapB family tyrosine-protein kinase [Alkalicaulis satelles]|uniref:CpsD/CapB family tyrosine-protein kinase n=1 Tax=Alkalicaulis satelles TaxID=2609175 RepID=A0A5M6ZK30_9PROT|nr:CpsD/CapB family tyrosine-protein kinase [Alkalicaulis satelles]KAA5804700.1 CpsD/CapB family tyrosine-protein kinase [Alkalicaulis satelles]
MSLETELDGLARTLVPRGARGIAVMVAPVTPGAGASFVACGLARRSARLNENAVWLYDLDFAKNPLSSGLAFSEDAYDGALNGSQFWRCEPAGAGRLALRRPEGARVWLSRFERAPGAVQRVVFQPSSAYWEQARRACALAILDAPSGSPAITALARDMDGVILVGDARATRRSQADAMAARIEAAGGRVLGVIVNRIQMRAAS